MPSLYGLDDLMIDTGRCVVERGGEQVDLPKLSYELLLTLVRNAPNVVSPDEMVAQVWSGRPVSPETLTQRIKLLRDALGDDAAHPRYILGVRGQGYRLIANVERLPPESAPIVKTQRPLLIASAAFLAVVAAFLLYWAYIGARSELNDRELTAEDVLAVQREFATSIVDALQATPSPEDVSRSDAIPTRNRHAYEYYLSGNEYARKEDSENMSLAARQYQKAVNEDIEFAIAWAALARAHSNLYFFGKQDRDRDLGQTKTHLERARVAVEQAARLAPDLPQTHLAVGYYNYHVLEDYESALNEWDLAERGMPEDSALLAARGRVYRRMGKMELAAENMDRAVELDPRNLDLLVTQEVTYESLRDYTRAEQILDRTLDIAPDNEWVPFRRPFVRFFQGDITSLDAALELIAMGMQVPEWRLWWAALYGRNYDVAKSVLDEWDTKVAEKDWHYGVTYELLSRPDLALPHFQAAHARRAEVLRDDPEEPEAHIELAKVLAYLDAEAAINHARQAMALVPTREEAVQGPRIRIEAIRIFVTARDYDAAIDALHAYLGAPGEWSIEGLVLDPRFDPIRQDERFQALVEKYRRP